MVKEFNTIAVDDGIAMGHGGMLYSLPSRELIADSVEYMVNAHCADAMVCISNCDKITPGMLMAAMPQHPVIFVSGGPMEAGKVKWENKVISLDLVDAMVKAADSSCSDEEVAAVERSACPTCGSCSGMFTANSMNCLTEALGLSLPGNGTIVATHADRRQLFLRAGRTIVELARRYYEKDDASVLPRSIGSFKAFENAISLDVAMGGSTNTVLHLLAAASEAGVDFTMKDIDRISRKVPCLCKVAPAVADVHIEGRASRRRHHGHPRRARPQRSAAYRPADRHAGHDGRSAGPLGCHAGPGQQRVRALQGGAGRRPDPGRVQPGPTLEELDMDRSHGVIRDRANAFSQDGGLAVLYGNIAEKGCIVKTAGVDESIWTFSGRARVFESQEAAVAGILADQIVAGDVVVIRYEGPKGGPGMQEMLYPTSYLKSRAWARFAHC